MSRFKKHTRALPLGIAAAGLALGAAPARAQIHLPQLDNPFPPTYDQHRNTSVRETPRLEYDPLGMRLGSFVTYPSIDVGVAVTSNAYLASSNARSDGYGILSPSLTAVSDWSRHEVRLSAQGAFRRYFSEPTLNRNEYDLRSLGRLDIGAYSHATAEAQYSRQREEPFTGQLSSSLATLSTFRRAYFTGRLDHQFGRTRVLVSADTTRFRFDPIEFADGTHRSQADRNRNITTVAGQAEYAVSPGIAFFGQVAYEKSNYLSPLLLTGDPNRDSESWRGLGGVNLDVPGFLRGTFGIGYSHRNYDAALYRSISALSFQMDLTYFLTQMTNIRLAAHRAIDDSAFVNNAAYYDTQVTLGIDHELRRNIILGVDALYGNQNYVRSPLGYDIYQINGNVQYLMSHRMRVLFDAGYSRRNQTGAPPNFNVDEAIGRLTFRFQV